MRGKNATHKICAHIGAISTRKTQSANAGEVQKRAFVVRPSLAQRVLMRACNGDEPYARLKREVACARARV
eukprot:6214294-Pleurochrysis_carterae.AAC.2